MSAKFSKSRVDRNSDDTPIQREPDQRCHFDRFGERCALPGSISPAAYTTEGDGHGKHYYCRPHFWLLEHRITEEECAEQIRKAKPVNWRNEALAHHYETHQDDPLMQTAQLIAQGKGDDNDKRDLIQDLKAKLQGIGKPLPYDPSKRFRSKRLRPNWRMPDNRRYWR